MFFECAQKYRCNNGKWKLQSVLQPNRILEFDGKLPIGANQWESKENNALCGQDKGYTRRLTFSQCYPDMFTCDTGHCRPLTDRCDIDFDCKDNTDENDCQKVKINDDYIKGNIPVSKTREPCVVYINITINSFPEISTKHVKFSADFYLNLRWNDLRLNFWDLDHNLVKNIIPEQDLYNIWHPTLIFTNSLGSQNPIGSMIGTVIRNRGPIEEDISFSPEG